MPPAPVDPAATRAALERQLALLQPVVDHLRRAAVAPSPFLSSEWQGPSADQANELVAELRARVREAEDITDDTVRQVRLQIALLS